MPVWLFDNPEQEVSDVDQIKEFCEMSDINLLDIYRIVVDKKIASANKLFDDGWTSMIEYLLVSEGGTTRVREMLDKISSEKRRRQW
jgi:hypothetical protein